MMEWVWITREAKKRSALQANSDSAKKLPECYEHGRFIGIFATVRYWNLSSTIWIQSLPFPLTPILAEWYLSFRSSHYNYVYVCSLFHANNMSFSSPSRPPWFGRRNSCWGPLTLTFVCTFFVPSGYFRHLGPKHSLCTLLRNSDDDDDDDKHFIIMSIIGCGINVSYRIYCGTFQLMYCRKDFLPGPSI
jgi:hypothetical protein